jgi:diamine N-acetyltransferase
MDCAASASCAVWPKRPPRRRFGPMISAPSTFSIRRAVSADAAPLSQLMADTFHHTWAPHYQPHDLAAYLVENYSPVLQEAQLRDPGAIILLAESSAGEAIGFARLLHHAPPKEVAAFGPPPAVELVSFYVRAEWHDQKVGAALFEEVLARIQSLGDRTLWLGVWPDNHRALKFYRARGFVQVGTHPFAVGSQVDDDLVMARVV